MLGDSFMPIGDGVRLHDLAAALVFHRARRRTVAKWVVVVFFGLSVARLRCSRSRRVSRPDGIPGIAVGRDVGAERGRGVAAVPPRRAGLVRRDGVKRVADDRRGAGARCARRRQRAGAGVRGAGQSAAPDARSGHGRSAQARAADRRLHAGDHLEPAILPHRRIHARGAVSMRRAATASASRSTGYGPTASARTGRNIARRRPCCRPRRSRRMMCATPSAQLIQHEWAKHGTCMRADPRRLFRQVERAVRAAALSRHERIVARAADRRAVHRGVRGGQSRRAGERGARDRDTRLARRAVAVPRHRARTTRAAGPARAGLPRTPRSRSGAGGGASPRSPRSRDDACRDAS